MSQANPTDTSIMPAGKIVPINCDTISSVQAQSIDRSSDGLSLGGMSPALAASIRLGFRRKMMGLICAQLTLVAIIGVYDARMNKISVY